MSKKTIKFSVPQPVYEAFYRMFPELGERSYVLRRLLALLLEKEGEQDCFIELMREELIRVGKEERDE